MKSGNPDGPMSGFPNKMHFNGVFLLKEPEIGRVSCKSKEIHLDTYKDDLS